MISVKSPLVSILVITYNQKDYIKKCLDSILMQKTNFPFECIIGDDCSTDGTKEIVLNYKKKYPDIIHVLTSEKNYGPVLNGLKGIRACNGKYMSVCDGDDYWNQINKLQKQVDFLEKHSDYGMVYSDIFIINEKEEKIQNRPSKTIGYYKSGYIFWDLMKNCFINTNTVLIRKKILDELVNSEYFDLKSKWFIYDYWFWLNASINYQVQFINEKMATYRIHNSNISNDKRFFSQRAHYVKLDVIKNFDKNFIHTEKDRNKIGGTLISMLFRKEINFTTKLTIIKLIIKYFPSIKYIYSKSRSKLF